jgi:hypothetical protein
MEIETAEHMGLTRHYDVCLSFRPKRCRNPRIWRFSRAVIQSAFIDLGAAPGTSAKTCDLGRVGISVNPVAVSR